jgi:hypothetical protein
MQKQNTSTSTYPDQSPQLHTTLSAFTLSWYRYIHLVYFYIWGTRVEVTPTPLRLRHEDTTAIVVLSLLHHRNTWDPFQALYSRGTQEFHLFIIKWPLFSSLPFPCMQAKAFKCSFDSDHYVKETSHIQPQPALCLCLFASVALLCAMRIDSHPNQLGSLFRSLKC